MVAYRFCRPDDIPRLVDAVNRCYSVHFPTRPAYTVDELRREMKEVQLWPSNCMLATAGDAPVGVVLGTKRPSEVLVRRIGVAPGHQRQGYGAHLLGSLTQKLAVLGPPRLVAEVPAELPEAIAFFTGAGWTVETTLVDWERSFVPRPRLPQEAFVDVGVADLETAGLLDPVVAWERQPEALAATAHLEGVALCGAERLEAWALFRRRVYRGAAASAGVGDGEGPAGGADVLALGCADGANPEAALAMICARLEDLVTGPLRLVAVAPGEHPEALLERLGFRVGSCAVRFAAEVVPA